MRLIHQHTGVQLFSPSNTLMIFNRTPSRLLFYLQGKLTSQGKLLQQETFFVTEQDAGVLSRSKERRVFLFEQIVIFSELLRKGSSTPGYQFKKSIKVSSGRVQSQNKSICHLSHLSFCFHLMIFSV